MSRIGGLAGKTRAKWLGLGGILHGVGLVWGVFLTHVG